MKIVDSLYGYVWRGNDNNCNTYAFAGVLSGGKHVVVDPGHIVTPMYREPGLERLIGAMAKDGIAAYSVGLVLLTHGHPDHCEAAAAFREEFRALVAIHEADAASFADLGGKADIYLQEGGLELGSGESVGLRIYHSPGHTPGHVTLYWPGRKVLIAGDCIFYRSTGRTDFPGGDARSLEQSIGTLSRLEIDYLLCGHAYGNPGIIRGAERVRENFRYIQGLFGGSAV